MYYEARLIKEADLILMRRIDELHLNYPFMGARMLMSQLAREGLAVGRRHIGTLMRRMGLTAQAPKPGTSKACLGHKVYPYLLRNVSITQANQVWALDTTYIPMAKGFVYLSAVVDVASRKVLVHKVATTLEAHHAVEIMQEAYQKYGQPSIVNTDQGRQFTAEEFTRTVLDAGVRFSMDDKGAWLDNVFVERVWRTIKYEDVYLKAYASVSEARGGIAAYIDWYNGAQAHSSIGDRTPNEAYTALLKTVDQEGGTATP